MLLFPPFLPQILPYLPFLYRLRSNFDLLMPQGKLFGTCNVIANNAFAVVFLHMLNPQVTHTVPSRPVPSRPLPESVAEYNHEIPGKIITPPLNKSKYIHYRVSNDHIIFCIGIEICALLIIFSGSPYHLRCRRRPPPS